MKKIIYFVLALTLTLASCAAPRASGDAGALRKIRLPMGYVANIQYAPFYVAVDKGYFAQEGIELEFDYLVETDGVKLVGAGELPFAIASGEQVLVARSKGLPVKYVFAWYQKFPISVVSAPELNIHSPADLRGKTIGLPGLYGATYVGLQALLFSADLTDADARLEPIGFTQIQSFAGKQQQIIVGYTANEPIVLKAQGIAVNELRAADYVQLVANGILTSESLIKEDPELIRKMTRALARGVTDTIADPEAAYAISVKYVENLAAQDKATQMQVLNVSIEFWRAERIGYSEPQAWENMNELLVKMQLIPAPEDLTQAFTNEFVP